MILTYIISNSKGKFNLDNLWKQNIQICQLEHGASHEISVSERDIQKGNFPSSGGQIVAFAAFCGTIRRYRYNENKPSTKNTTKQSIFKFMISFVLVIFSSSPYLIFGLWEINIILEMIFKYCLTSFLVIFTIFSGLETQLYDRFFKNAADVGDEHILTEDGDDPESENNNHPVI